MKYLSESRLSRITIQDREAVDFFVPVELAALVFLFLASKAARLVALVAWAVVRDLVTQYQRFCDYLAGWRNDLIIMKLALLDLFGVPVEFAGV